MYKHHPSLVFGFHACEREVGEGLLSGSKNFKASKNSFDWLGNGMYFWENSPHRAEAYGQELKNERKKLKDPVVVGAVIHLGYCFDLLESHSLSLLKSYYYAMVESYEKAGDDVPQNESANKKDDNRVFRKLDCAVFEYMHSVIKKTDRRDFDSVRGAFWEGDELYPSAGFNEKNHIQICIRNPNCIKGFFRPLEIDKDYESV